MSEVDTDRTGTGEARPDTGDAAGDAVRDGIGRGQSPLARRVVFLDVARALAMIGVVMMNVSTVVYPAEMLGEAASGTLTTIVDVGLTVVMSGKARTMLMVLLGAGAVLAWRSAARRGGRPMAVMLRRYAILGVLFGLPHLAVFPGDILAHYALTALLLALLMPLLLGGSRRRPLVAAAVSFAAVPVADLLLSPVIPELVQGLSVSLVPQTFGFFCVGVWLARRPELTAGTDAAGTDTTEPGGTVRPPRLPLRMLVFGAVVLVLSTVPMFLASVLFPVEFGPDGIPVRSAGETVLVLLGHTLMNLGGALIYLGLVWWLVLRGRRAARVLGVLAPLGRVTLTMYLGSTAFFLLTMGPFEGVVPRLAQYGLAAVYFVVSVVLAGLWARRFRLGPLEWLWRSLTHLRPVALRRGPQPPATDGSTRTSAPSRTGADNPPTPRHSSSSTNTLT